MNGRKKINEGTTKRRAVQMSTGMKAAMGGDRRYGGLGAY